MRIPSEEICMLEDCCSSDGCYQESRNCIRQLFPTSSLMVAISVLLTCLLVFCRQPLAMCGYPTGHFTVEILFPTLYQKLKLMLVH